MRLCTPICTPPSAARRLAAGLLLALLLPLMAWADGLPAAIDRAWPSVDAGNLAVDPAEIVPGGPPKDGIPAITGPRLHAVAEKDALDPREPVMVLEMEGETPRAYPVRYLMWHEIVNDVVGGVPVAVTFCPLCNSGVVFDRRVDGRTLEFGVSGLLRHSDMIMYDRETESWWQQFSGEAIGGPLAGAALTALPARLEGWQGFAGRNPEGLVMAEPEGHARPYGRNPYEGYDTGRPFLYRGAMPPEGIDPMARVVRIGDRAWPLTRLREAGEIVEAGYRLTWREGQASALDTARIGEGREVGDIRVRDAGTGADVVHDVVFAFVFRAFEPEGRWMTGG
jgi:hypothetical protein